jgi:ABC-2 type transport system permease protein
MLTEMRYTLLKLRGQILGWGLGLALLGLMIVGFYGTFMGQQARFLEMIENYPPEFLAFFGGDAATLATPEGYLSMYGFSMLPVIIGIFAVLAGSGLLASDEENGQLDLILAHPLSRTALYGGRLLAFALACVAIVTLGWLGFVVMLGGSTLAVGWGAMARPFISLLAQAFVYGAVALALSMFVPARRLAAAGAALLMVTSYFLSSFSGLSESLAPIARLLPYHYFQGGSALNGLNLAWLAGLLAVAAALALLGWWRFEHRDIRVAGEGAWFSPGRLAKLR